MTARRATLAIVACLTIVVLIVAGRVFDRAEVGGVDSTTNTDVLAPFALEQQPPTVALTRTSAVSLAAATIGHSDPLNLAARPISIAATPSSSRLAESVAAAFRSDGYRGSTSIAVAEADAAILQLCRGDATIAVMDRPLLPVERSRCFGKGFEVVQLPVALDRFVIAAHPDNFWIGDVDSDDLPSLLVGQSWHDVDPSWPERPMHKYLPGIASSEFGVMFANDSPPLAPDNQTLPGATFESEATERLRRLAADPDGVSVVSLGALRRSTVDFVERPIDRLDPLSNRSYPIERTIYVVLDRNTFDESIETATFVAYVLNQVDIAAPLLHLVRHRDIEASRRMLVDMESARAWAQQDTPRLGIEEDA